MFVSNRRWQLLALFSVLGAHASACTSLAVDNMQTSGAGAPGGGGAGSVGAGGSTSGGGTDQGGAGALGGSGGSQISLGGTGGGPGDAGTFATGGASSDGGPAFEYGLIDFAGASTGSQLRTLADWDTREKLSFEVSSTHTTSATVEVANSQAELAFAEPDPVGGGSVFQFVKIPAATGNGDNWGGWAHIIFGLGSALSEELVAELPQWQNASASLSAGTKLIQLDVYYDDTVDPNFDWDDLLAIESGGTDVWNAVPAQGYKIDLHLVNYSAHADVAGGHDSAGIYIGYSAYLTQPNAWVTLTFDAADEGRAENFFSAGSVLAAAASQIDGIDIKPSGGYESRDSNPVYIRNLRIVEAP